jgi:hypothetical protein
LLLASAAIGLAGCSGSLLADHIPTAAGGLPGDAPARPDHPPDYPAVHDMPPARATATLNDDQQKLLENDLVAVRNRVNPSSAGPGAAGSSGNSAAGASKNP